MKPFITKSSNLDLLQMSPFIRASLMIVPIKNKISSPCPFQNQGLKNHYHLSFTETQMTYTSIEWIEFFYVIANTYSDEDGFT